MLLYICEYMHMTLRLRLRSDTQLVYGRCSSCFMLFHASPDIKLTSSLISFHRSDIITLGWDLCFTISPYLMFVVPFGLTAFCKIITWRSAQVFSATSRWFSGAEGTHSVCNDTTCGYNIRALLNMPNYCALGRVFYWRFN